MLAMRAKHVECTFMFALVWSLGSTGTEAGQRAFLEFLENIVTDLGVIDAEWEGVSNALQVTALYARGSLLLTHSPSIDDVT